MNGRTLKAYFTVEAALVMPFVFGIIFFIIYFFFFQYNRCLLEQDMARLVIYSRGQQELNKEKMALELQKRADFLSENMYVAWNGSKVKISLKQNNILIEKQGQIVFPFSGLNFWGSDNTWKMNAAYKSQRLSPTFFVRHCKKLLGGK